MNNKKKIIISGVIILLLVLFVLCVFVLVAIKDVKINFYKTSTLNEDEIITKLEKEEVIPYGVSAFFVNKQVVASNIEYTIPRLKVINVELVFPSTIKINCLERQNLFAIKSKSEEDKVTLLDNEFKVLDKDKQGVDLSSVVELQIDEGLVNGELALQEGRYAMFDYIYETVYFVDKVLKDLTEYSTFCKHFTKLYIEQGFNHEMKKVAKLHFYTASSKEVILDDPLYNTDERVDKLLNLATGDEFETEDVVVI